MQKNIRRRFSKRHIIGSHHFVKPIGNSYGFECFLNHHARATGRDRHRHLATQGFGKSRNFINQLDRVKPLQVGLAFRKSHRLGIKMQIVFVVQFDHDVTSRTPTHRKEHIFFENSAGTINRQSLAPRLKVRGHGVCKRAVKIKNHRVKSRGRKFKRSNRCHGGGELNSQSDLGKHGISKNHPLLSANQSSRIRSR